MAMSAEAAAPGDASVGPPGASVGEGKVKRGAQREFVNARVMRAWDACVKRERPRVGTRHHPAEREGKALFNPLDLYWSSPECDLYWTSESVADRWGGRCDRPEHAWRRLPVL